MGRKPFIPTLCVAMAAMAMAQGTSSSSQMAQGWNRYAITQATAQNQWDNLTQQQRNQIEEMNQKHLEAREACKDNPSDPNCKDLHKRQKNERQNLAQNLGLKHLPQAEHNEHRPQHHGSPGPGYGRPQRGNSMPPTPVQTPGKPGRK